MKRTTKLNKDERKTMTDRGVLYSGFNKQTIPDPVDFKERMRERPKVKDGRDKIGKLADTTASTMIAESTKSRKALVPDLRRQPKTLKAVGIAGLMKQKEKSKIESDGENMDGRKPSMIKGKKTEGAGVTMQSMSRSSQSDSTATGQNKLLSEDKRSLMSSTASPKRSILMDKRSQTVTVIEKSISGQRMASTITSEEDSMNVTDSDWDVDYDRDRKSSKDDESKEPDVKYEMATVEIDVNDAQEVMDDVLTKMLAEGRITTRQRETLAEKFELMLQSLVSFQEREVELIEFLNMKSDILKLLNNFVKTEEQLHQVHAAVEEESIEDGSSGGATGGILGTKKAVDEQDKRDQGLSVAEMSATTIRETLLAQKNKIEMQEHMKTIHILELRQLEFEKALLAITYSRMTKPADVQREMKELKRAVHELQMEVSQTSQEIQQYEVDIAVEEKACDEDEALVEKLDLEVLTKQMQVQTNANKPVHLAKEADRDANKLEQLNDEFDTLCNKHLEGLENLRSQQNKLDVLLAELHSLIKEEGRMAQIRKHSLHETETLVTQMETLVAREQQLVERANQMAEKMAAVLKTRKKLQEDVYAVSNETNKALREASKLERTLRMTTDAHLNAKLAYDKMRLAFDTARPKDDANNWDKLTRMLQREIANLKVKLNQKLDEATIKAELVDRLQRQLNDLYDEQLESGKQLQHLIRTTVRKRREREEKSEQCIKLEAQIFKLVQDARMQRLVLDDCARTEKDLHNSMNQVKIEYNKVKIARAGLMNDLISAKQKVSEQAEKFKICNNELESFTNQLMERSREIHRAHYLTLNASLARDSVRNHALRCRDKYRLYRKEKSELLLTNKTFRLEVVRLRNDINATRARFEAETHRCNKTAMRVRERTEEICTITEKIKAYEIIMLKGNQALTIREMELTKLNSLVEEIKKHSYIVISKQPDEGKIINEIQSLRKEFYDVTERRRKMEEELNDVNNPERTRNINHELLDKRETVPVLQERLSRLEEALAMRECEGLEKELVIKQVTQITEDSMAKANYLKETYKHHTSSLCSLRKQLYQMSYKIDGFIAETAIAVTQADLAEKRYHELADELREAEHRFCQGLPPVDSMLEEWKHLAWKKEMLRRSNENSKRRFLRSVKPLSGSQIVMERLRPNKKLRAPAQLTNCPCRLPHLQ